MKINKIKYMIMNIQRNQGFYRIIKKVSLRRTHYKDISDFKLNNKMYLFNL